MTIGDPLVYSITISYPQNYKLVLPEERPDITNWNITDEKREVIPSKPDTGIEQTTLRYTMTTYSTGTLVIPALIFTYTTETKEEKKIETQSIEITVESVLQKYGNQGDIRDIKGPARFKHPWWYYLWFLIPIAVLAGIYIWYQQWKKRKRGALAESSGPVIPPHQKALEELQTLQNSGLIAEGRIKEFYIALTNIIRDYLAGCYRVETRDRTTAELYHDLRARITDRKYLGSLKDFFDSSDLVKFARYRPDETMCRADIESARALIIIPETSISNTVPLPGDMLQKR